MQENMRRGNNRPQQAIYKPGSGPLRKSDHGLDEEPPMGSSKPVKNQAPSRQNKYRQEEHFNQSRSDEVLDNSMRNTDSSDKRRHRKPEQPIYIPLPVAKARESEKKTQIDSEPIRNTQAQSSNERNLNGNNNSDNRNMSSNKPKKYLSKRKGNEAYDEWRNNAEPFRQGSESRLQQNNAQNNWNRRDTRSVEPAANFRNYPPDTRGPPMKPPSGRRHSTIGVEPEKRQKPPINLDNLPPRFRKKHLDESKYICNNVPEEWDGSSITFQGTAPNYYQKPMTLPPNLAPSQHVTTNNRIYNTLPNKPRGRGRLQNEQMQMNYHPGMYSPVNSRPGTPTFPPTDRDRTRSTESLNRLDSRSQTPVNYHRNDDYRYAHAHNNANSNYYRRSEDRYMDANEGRHPHGRHPHQQPNQQANQHNNSRHYNREKGPVKSYMRDRQSGQSAQNVRGNELELEAQMSAVSLTTPEDPYKVNFESISNEAFDWSEEVELHVKNLEEGLSDAMTRSSSLTSLTESISKNPPQKTKRSRRKKDRRNRRTGSAQREKSIDSPAEHHFQVPERRTRSRNASREPSFDRHRKSSCSDEQHTNWREEIRARRNSDRERDTPGPEEGARRGGIIHLPKEDPKPPVLTLRERPTMPEMRKSPGQQKTLFDPQNPNRPIIINKPNSRVSSTSFSENCDQGNYSTSVDQMGNVRPAWHNENTDNFKQSHYPNLLKDIRRVDAEMQNFTNPQQILQCWMHIHSCRIFLQDSLLYLLREDVKFAERENIEQYFWKLLYYNFIEIMRKAISNESENNKQYKEFLLVLIDEGTAFYDKLLEMLQGKYSFKLEQYTGVNAYSKSMGYVQLALVSAQKIYMCLGDLFRYKETVNETSNYGKCRQLYIKAHEINSKNGRPYNQLAVLAIYSKKKLDAVYYYMRSLMSANPVPSARESLISLFDENRKKYEHERKRREERLEKARLHMKEKESANAKTRHGSLRKETWIRPDGGRRMHRTTSTLQETKTFDSEEEDLAALTSVEVNKRFVTSYLHVHGKLITKTGMETFHETALQMLKEFRALLQHSPVPLPSSRFLQLLALNMFAIDSTKLKDPELQPGLRSELQERALTVSLEMFSLILEKCVSILSEHINSAPGPANINVLQQDALELLPSVKIWCDWMLCHSRIWNPPPSTQDYKVGPSGDAWTRVATLMNLLENLDQSIVQKFKEELQDGYEQVRLPEDNTLSGFTPLMCNVMQTATFVPHGTDIEAAQFALRLNRLLFFGTEFLCGVEPPILKLEYRNDAREYVSVVCTTANRSAPNTPPEFNESELLVESFSDEDEECNPEHVVLENTSNEIQELLTRKSELERRQRDQELHRQTVQKILQQSVVSVHIEVKPKNLVPDTNCFIDYLAMLKKIALSNVYSLMVPLIVLNELEGLTKGAKTPERVLNPMHALKVAEASKAALDYLGSRPTGVKCVTTKGTILTSTTFTKEDDATVDVNATNDDRILATCMMLCKGHASNAEQSKGEPRKIHREVVLLTEDRNLRVKALARDVPVREVPSFLQWAGLS